MYYCLLFFSLCVSFSRYRRLLLARHKIQIAQLISLQNRKALFCLNPKSDFCTYLFNFIYMQNNTFIRCVDFKRLVNVFNFLQLTNVHLFKNKKNPSYIHSFYHVLFELQQRAFGKGLEDAGISDPHALDKNYWIQRVGEVSKEISFFTQHGKQCDFYC